MSIWRAPAIGIFLVCICFLGFHAGCTKPPQMKKPPKEEPVAKPAPLPEFMLEATPNSPLALGNEFREQTGTVEVLKGWKVRYKVKEGVDPNSVEWLQNGTSIGTKSPLERPENTLGEFTITYKVNGNNSGVSRTLIVGEVTSNEFKLEVGASYKKSDINPNWVQPPTLFQGHAIVGKGKVSKTAASPSLTQFRWGFVQDIESKMNLKWHPRLFSPDPNTKGTLVTHPDYLSALDIPPNTNDSIPGHQLYGKTNPKKLGEDGSFSDAPGVVDDNSPMKYVDNGGKQVLIVYTVTTANTAQYKCKVWQVVFIEATKQYVPLREQAWTLDWDTADPGPWKVQLVGNPANASTKPSDAQNSVLKYLTTNESAQKTTTKIR